MNKKALQQVRDKLSNLEASSPYDTKELEVCMDALASAIFILIKKPNDDEDEEPSSLGEAINLLPISRSSKHRLREIYSEISEIIEASDYESNDEDHDDIIEELKTDFHSILEEELVKIAKDE